MPDAIFLRRCAEHAESATPFVMVTLVETTGSTPADVGAKMLVTAAGLDAGTVGGGRLEAAATDTALAMLREEQPVRFVDWSLKADVGMTCGGRVKLFFELVSPTAWPIVIFGAGHVTQALVRLLLTLPCRVICIDPRSDWLAKLPDGVEKITTKDPAAEVEQLPDNAFVLCMTKGHQSDLPVLQAIFQQNHRFPYLGVIGSKAKAAVLRKELIASDLREESLVFHCPIGLPLGSNAPSEIAVSIAAQLLEQRDQSTPSH